MAALVLAAALRAPAFAQTEYQLVPGDILRISVFKNPDMSLDARVSETGAIGYPLIGSVQVAGLSLPGAERKMAQLLKQGGFVVNPQVNILLTQGLGNLVSVIGEVNKPGRYSIELAGGRLSGMLATAGGVGLNGGDLVGIWGSRGGKPFRRDVDVLKLSSGNGSDDLELAGGD